MNNSKEILHTLSFLDQDGLKEVAKNLARFESLMSDGMTESALIDVYINAAQLLEIFNRCAERC